MQLVGLRRECESSPTESLPLPYMAAKIKGMRSSEYLPKTVRKTYTILTEENKNRKNKNGIFFY